MLSPRKITNEFSWKLGIVLCIFIFNIPKSFAQRSSDGSRNSPSNLKDALLIYPPGIRSERDLPVCPGWAMDEEESKVEVGPSFSPASISSGINDINKLQSPASTRNPSTDLSSKKVDASKYLSACNIIHKRYFYPPMIERLCRCPDRNECPMEWSSPPKYKDQSSRKNNNSSNKIKDERRGSRQPVSTTPSSIPANEFDPYTVMISSRSQLKFCTEVSTNLPRCEKSGKLTKDSILSDEFPSMIKTIRKTLFSPELPSVSVNCYCPPLYHGWKFLSKKIPEDSENGTADANYSYSCDTLRRCKSSQQCGTIRTDFHFSYYSCTCPKKNICVPKIYPPDSIDDVINEAEEALYSGQVSPAYCSPE